MKFGRLEISINRTGCGIIYNFCPSKKPSKQISEPFIIKREKPIRLNIGGAKGHPKVAGWQTVDIRSSADYQLDLANDKLPFENDSVDVIFCSHTLEHIIPQRLLFVLDEFRRVLDKNNSLIRISVPDISKAIRAYYENDNLFFKRSDISPFDKEAPLGGQFASWCYTTRLNRKTQERSDMMGHVNCFDKEYLIYCLKKSGFNRVWESSFRNSVYGELQGPAFDKYPHDSLFVEANP